ncbi:hypothetical protein [Zobellia uliginosa]|uniref:hypothetical protein n=1 Tax=Zobellia uliginosa TaxID=143224 RepID=UPI001C075568|nr:hypothetical protein [Zobellia uliginosa]MBU2948144.1 hypothetical protein [Zobellia uliginosa]
MKIKYVLLFFTAIYSLISCTEGTEIDEPIAKEEPIPEEPKEEVYLTYRLNEHSDTTEIEYWVIVHDQDGELLDYKSIKEDSTLTFSAIDTALVNTEKLVVTTLSVAEYENHIAHNLLTYTNIQKGFKWNSSESGEANSSLIRELNIGKTNHSNNKLNSKVGDYTITVNSVPAFLKYHIQSPETGVVARNDTEVEGDRLQVEGLELQPGIRYLISIGDTEELPKYTFFEISDDSKNITLDYTEFTDYDQVLETTLPENTYLFSVSKGYDNSERSGRGYEMVVEIDFDNPEISRIGYISGFKSYLTQFNLTMKNNYTYRYSELSELPLEQITILEKPNFSIIENSLYNFEFSTDISYLTTSSIWRSEEASSEIFNNYTSWRINSSNTSSHLLGEIPEELINLYPKLNLEKLKYSDTELQLLGQDYQVSLNVLSNPTNVVYPIINESLILYPEQE